MINIDGRDYNIEWVAKSFKRTADIINGDNSGRLQNNKDMYLDYMGTFFNFSGQIIKGKNCTVEEWDEVFMLLSNPINKHLVKVPFNQSQMETYIYISKCEQALQKVQNGVTIWDSKIDVQFVSLYSQWLAGGTLQGVI